jgi:hypothetical protein
MIGSRIIPNIWTRPRLVNSSVATKKGKSEGNTTFRHRLIPDKAASKLCLGLKIIVKINNKTHAHKNKDDIYILRKYNFFTVYL